MSDASAGVKPQEEGGGGVAESDDGVTKVEVVYDPKGVSDDFASRHDPEQAQRPRSLTLFSPCKVNLFLRVTGKRPDGYHDLASLFHVISLGDTLKFSVSPSTTRDALTTTAPGVPIDDSNLVIRALNIYREKTGSATRFWIHLEKKVPTGAGLGGGSGNAATALWAANEMCGRPASEAELQAWAAEIGSDVPFFFSHGAAYCTGRGEIVEDLKKAVPLDTPLVLMKPPEECSTAAIYKRFVLEKASRAAPRELLERVTREGLSQDVCVNDLEAPAFEELPALKALKRRVLAAGRGRYRAVFMSGSGSTIVGVGSPDPPEFLYDDDAYRDVFITDAYFLRRRRGQWYQPRGGDMSSPQVFGTDEPADDSAVERGAFTP